MEDTTSTFKFGGIRVFKLKSSDVSRLKEMIEYAVAINETPTSDDEEDAHHRERSEIYEKQLLESYDFSNIDITKESDILPFLVASSVGFLPLLEKWKSHGLPFNVADHDGETALHFIAWNPYSINNLSIAVQFLLKNGANANALTENKENPLHYMGYSEENEDTVDDRSKIMEELVNAGADINASTKKGITPLFVTLANTGHSSTVEIMLNLGAELTVEYKTHRMCFLESITYSFEQYSVRESNSNIFMVEEPLAMSEKAVRHVVRLNVLGLHVDEYVQWSTDKLMLIVEDVRKVWREINDDRHLGKSMIDKFKKECEREKEKMKRSKLYGVCVYDLAMMSGAKSLEFTNKEVSQGCSSSNKYREDFPIYWFTLRFPLMAAKERKGFLSKAMEILKSYNSPLPDLCLYHILKYFTNMELYVLISIHSQSASVAELKTRDRNEEIESRISRQQENLTSDLDESEVRK